ncbi:MAG TPA: tetratricopeptide repeat protein [Candidatus Angelobacter sp.]|nr:tetratricopeptide repeat protein [Candidatus Angelobacter sp.]
MKNIYLGIAFFCSLFMVSSASTQTFEINGQSSDRPKQDQQKSSKKGPSSAAPPSGTGGQSSSNGLSGYGGSIEGVRFSRAATDALKRGNYAAAMNYAQRLAQHQPNDANAWFLLGYSARLAGQYQTSLDAYKRGLQLNSRSVEGLSGMAQTYMRMGRSEDAKRILLEVIAANPQRATDLAIAGELFIQSGDLPKGTNLLERSEAVQPSSHAELLLAIAYMKQKQPEKAKQLLDKARARNPKDTNIFRAVAQFYRESHDYKSAIETLKQAPRKDADLLAELGFTYELAGMKKESAETYEKAAGMAPQVINIQLAAAQAELRVGNLEKTRSYLARGEQLDPKYYRLHAIRGDLAKLERRDNDSIREYLAALAAMPEGPAEGILYPTQLRLNLIEAYKNTGDDAAIEQQLQIARQELAKLQVEGPQRVEYLRLRASIKALGNDVSGAEADLKEALTIDPVSDNVTLQYGSLLWKMGRKAEARQMYANLLQRDDKNRYALEAMGYLARDEGDTKTAELYFNRMAAAYPTDYVPYLALGDLYTATRDFDKADTNYQQAFKLAPTNSVIIAGGANAAIEAHKIPLAGEWLARATGTMKDDPRVMRESERYLFHKGNFAESARIGQLVIQKLPRDREASVYLAYDLYNLGRYDDVLALVSRFESILPKEPNFPLLAGHVHKQTQLLQQAIDDYTRAQQKDPKMVEAYVNRGYVRNDMQDAPGAIRDFEPALKLNPDNGIAHLGLAFSNLQLHHSREALAETEKAEKLLGESGATHLAYATAYRQMRVLNKAEAEYRLALKYAPDDLKLHIALADTLYHARHYNQSIVELQTALQLSPNDPLIYANLASAHAQLRQRDQTYRYIEAAERSAPDQSAIYIATGDALMTLGERQAAMDRFSRALEAPDANRVDVRLEFAKLFVREGKFEDAKQQVALAFAESRIGEASPVTTDNMVEAANIFLNSHEFDLASRYFAKAKDMGAPDDSVAIGLADTYLAQGDDRHAEQELAALGTGDEYKQNYDYQLAWANLYHLRHDNLRAISAYAQANHLAADDTDVAEHALILATGEEGKSILPRLTMRSDFSTGAVFEDATIYQMDSGLFGFNVPPRSSQETQIGTTFRYHPSHFLPISGYFGERNIRGTSSIPIQTLILKHNTYDTIFNVGVEPVLRLGNARFVLNPGIEFTIRRDTESPVNFNQQLFRQFLYLNSSPLFNWLTVRASAVHESGPYSQQNLSSRDLGASVEFEVGRPWGHNSFVTGYSVRDLLFNPLVREYFTTSTWAGYERKFGQKFSITGLGRVMRSWRVQDQNFTIAQILVPGVRFEFKPNDRWSVDGAFDLSRGQGFHLYDNFQSGFLISYMKPLRRSFDDGTGGIAVDYPLRISFGLQQQSFPNFTGQGSTASFRPVIRVSVF